MNTMGSFIIKIISALKQYEMDVSRPDRNNTLSIVTFFTISPILALDR